MPTQEQVKKLKDTILKYPDQKDTLLAYAKSKGFTDEDLSDSPQSFPQAFRSTLGKIGRAIDVESDAMAEGVASGATWGMMDVPKRSTPGTVNIPFIGETSPSRAVGTVLGAVLSPIGWATGSLTRAAAPIVGNVAATALSGATAGAGLETVKQLAFDDEMDVAKIGTTAALFLAGDLAAEYAPAAVSQLRAWGSKIPKSKMELVERFKELPEVRAEAENLAKTSPLFNKDYQEMLQRQKLAQDQMLGIKPLGEDRMLPAPPVQPTRIQENPETALAGTRETIDRTINPNIPLLPTDAMAGMSSSLRESPEVIAAARTRAEIQSPSRQIASTSSAQAPPSLPFMGPERAAQIAELEGFKAAAEQKMLQAQRRNASKAMAKRPSESTISGSESTLPYSDAKKLPIELSSPGQINLSNVLVGDITRKNAQAILGHAKELEKAAKKKLAEKAAKSKAKKK